MRNPRLMSYNTKNGAILVKGIIVGKRKLLLEIEKKEIKKLRRFQKLLG